MRRGGVPRRGGFRELCGGVFLPSALRYPYPFSPEYTHVYIRDRQKVGRCRPPIPSVFEIPGFLICLSRRSSQAPVTLPATQTAPACAKKKAVTPREAEET